MNEITILSGKGGTGKTSLSAAFATLQDNLIVADCDVDAANLHLILQPQNRHNASFITGYKAVVDYNKCTSCGLCVSYCRFDALAFQGNRVTVSETSCDGCKLCSRICPSHAITMDPSSKSQWFIGSYRHGHMVHARLAPGEENSGKLVNVVREEAKKVATQQGCNTIIIDGPPGTGCPVISSITGVKKAIVVTEPTNSGFHDLKRILELTSNFKVKAYVVINKYDLNPAVATTIEQWCTLSSIPVIGKIPFAPEVVQAMVSCKSITEYAPNSEVSLEVVRIWNLINTTEE